MIGFKVLDSNNVELRFETVKRCFETEMVIDQVRLYVFRELKVILGCRV